MATWQKSPQNRKKNSQIMPINEIQEVLLKYKNQEDTINAKLKSQILEGLDANDKKALQIQSTLSLKEVKERNKSILKDLEIVKGNLRSKAIFSPMEMQWKKILENYHAEPSLPVTKWKCDNPVFV